MVQPSPPRTEPERSVPHPGERPDTLLRVSHASIGYRVNGAFTRAVADVSFDVAAGETIMLIGPSGCGKSTLLKTIAGFLDLADGTITVAGRRTLAPGPDRAVVFQEFDQLFPWRDVLDNVAYPLRRNGRTKAEAEQQARRYLEMMGLSRALDRHPHQLSGGMKQRVAIARAFALEPVMLLMDEPFGALDALTRARLQAELNAIAKRTGVTILFVTHSIEEAIVLGDRVVVLTDPPSVVREVVTITEEAKVVGSEQYRSVRTHLGSLLHRDGKEADEDVAEFTD
ncbi:ABC transporter ATP-binding protein [Verrucosispora sp. WMMA2121]|uniref:ABC transporter ATP-binding protein n=1 Tax=Verrucosispora sioxanthis TaxID=2499994 RepID=A0A6M1KTX2_9ACTN|nr:ABC transporter ATP-binding protein [Verrucosispora sp. WMMA2121]MCZ7422356.1 ABC transporter ATP-binding protein [Verrucosispora sp. WMMA2121]NEE64338.1 ABC transporter ATP-binding protein [Verrucosispora sioxanthis]NGM13448.1 ABC transporter ATP-binding protein [Verrucosispora sioxanthis]